MVHKLPLVGLNACAICRVGAASGVGFGGQCPMVDRRRRAGARLYVAGEPADKIWYVKEGSVLLSREAGDGGGEGVAWAVRRPGSLLGLEGLVRATYLDSARAVSDVVLCAAPRQELEQWLGSRGDGARALLDSVLLAQCADAPRRAGADGSARQRLASWLLDQPRGRAAELPRNVIAGLLGMLPETLSRALAALAALGAIEVTRRQVDIRDVEVLEEIAAGHARRSSA